MPPDPLDLLHAVIQEHGTVLRELAKTVERHTAYFIIMGVVLGLGGSLIVGILVKLLDKVFFQ